MKRASFSNNRRTWTIGWIIFIASLYNQAYKLRKDFARSWMLQGKSAQHRCHSHSLNSEHSFVQLFGKLYNNLNCELCSENACYCKYMNILQLFGTILMSLVLTWWHFTSMKYSHVCAIKPCYKFPLSNILWGVERDKAYNFGSELYHFDLILHKLRAANKQQ